MAILLSSKFIIEMVEKLQPGEFGEIPKIF